MKKLIFLAVLGLLSAGAGKGQTVVCSGGNKDCPRKSDIIQAVASLPALPDWTVISVSTDSVWRAICERKCDISAFTNLGTRRTYLFTEKIFARSGPTGLRAYLAHELGHILTNSASETLAENKAKELIAGCCKTPE